MRKCIWIIRRTIFYSIAIALSLSILVTAYTVYIFPTLPSIEEIRIVKLNYPLRIYSRDQKLIAEYGNERRIPVDFEKVPTLLIDSIIATEDQNFYDHYGIDFIGVIRAIMTNISSGKKQQGASTITMQVARNLFLDRKKTYLRKYKEVLLAFKLEYIFTKNEILELYLNKIFLGHRAYGFAAAAQIYYGQDLEKLSLPELAMLAGLPQAPSANNPISDPIKAKIRRDFVLKRLHETGKIDNYVYENAKTSRVTAHKENRKFITKVHAPYAAEIARGAINQHFDSEEVYTKGFNVTLTIHSSYQDSARAALRNGIMTYDRRHKFNGPIDNINTYSKDADEIESTLQKYPASGEIIPAIVTNISRDKISVKTKTLQHNEMKFQQVSWAFPNIKKETDLEEDTISNVFKVGDIIYIKKISDNESNISWQLSQIPKVNGALVTLDTKTGEILALSGGFDFYLSKFNRVTQALRQPGSNIKPFIYAAALDAGYSPLTTVSAAPIVMLGIQNELWKPANYSNKFFGPQTLRYALSKSLNLVSVRLVRDLGLPYSIDFLTRFGFSKERLANDLSIALGNTSVTPLEVATAFSTIANGGFRVQPKLILDVHDSDGKKYYLPTIQACEPCTQKDLKQNDLEMDSLTTQNPSNHQEQRVISAETAFLTQSLMQEVIQRGTGRRALSLNRADLAGKTGTTNNFQDAWFSGFTPEVATTVYIGFDDPETLGNNESGAKAALPIWIEHMRNVLKDYPEQPIYPPDSLESKFINRETRKETTISDQNGYFEYFRKNAQEKNQEQNGANQKISF